MVAAEILVKQIVRRCDTYQCVSGHTVMRWHWSCRLSGLTHIVLARLQADVPTQATEWRGKTPVSYQRCILYTCTQEASAQTPLLSLA
jgi:hypothetical protein